MFFKQIKDKGDNFSYLIADDSTKEAVVVDPSFNTEKIIQLTKKYNVNIKYIFNTHDHWDHIAGNGKIKSIFGAKVVGSKLSNVDKDSDVVDGETLRLGKIVIQIIHTPGHSPDSISLLIDGKLLTGDTLFVGECGRTDLSGGNVVEMYKSLFQKLMMFDDNIEVFPGHDYGKRPYSTIGMEKKTNYVLKDRSLEEFIEFMSEP